MQSEDDNENMEHINEDGGKDNKKDNKNESFGNKKEENEEIEEMKLLEVKKSLSLTNSRLLSLKTSIHKVQYNISIISINIHFQSILYFMNNINNKNSVKNYSNTILQGHHLSIFVNCF